MVIRLADENDIGSIKELLDRNFDEIISNYHTVSIVNKFKEHNSIDNLKTQLTWKKVYVADDKGRIVGTGAFANFGTESEPKYSVSNLYVLPELHRKGIGKQIMKVLLTDAEENNAHTFHVPSTRNGIRFYENSGFKVDDIQPDTGDEITWMTLCF